MLPTDPRRHSARFVVLVALLLTACGRPPVQLIEVETEKEANEILVLLDSVQVDGAEKESVSAQRKTVWRVNVPSTRARAARLVLDRLGLPREDRGGLGTVLESGSVIPSAQSERARLIHAKSDKLARTLESHERVLTARVHIVLPEEEIVPSDDGLGSEKRPKASVYLRYLRAWPPTADGRGSTASAGGPVGAAPGRDWLENRGVAVAEFQESLAALAGLPGGEFEQVLTGPGRLDEAALRGSLRNVDDSAAEAIADLLRVVREPTDAAWPLPRHDVVSLVSSAVEGLRASEVEVVYSPIDLDASTITALRGGDEQRWKELQKLNQPIGIVAGLLGLLSLYLLFLLRRERRRARGEATVEA